MRFAFYTYSFTDRLEMPLMSVLETFTDMKFETACDVGFETLSAARRAANRGRSE